MFRRPGVRFQPEYALVTASSGEQGKAGAIPIALAQADASALARPPGRRGMLRG